MERVCPECGTHTEELTCPNDGEMTLVVKKKKVKEKTMVGKVIGGRYRVTEVIGQGGFGAVYKCIHTATGDTLAIKVLRTDLEDNLDVVARFRLEAKATSRLKHPNTVRVFDFGQMDDGNLFLAMEFLDGCTLTDLMRREGPLEPERLVRIGLQVLKSLSEAHSKGLVHRDLKPDNIFVQNMHGEPDFVRVLDFGIAKSMTAEQMDITSTGAVIGTPKYMSPEQARGQSIDQRTDLYSLGVMLFEGISGAPPFVADTPLAMILRRVTEEPPRVHDNLALPTPIGLCDVVLKSLHRNPENRYETADEMATALSNSLATPIHLPRLKSAIMGENVPSGTVSYSPEGIGNDATAAYEPADVDVTLDHDLAIESPSDESASAVVHTDQPVDFDQATAVASADELAEAAAAMSVPNPEKIDADDVPTALSPIVPSVVSTNMPPVEQGSAQSPLKVGMIVGVGIAIAVLAGIGLSVMSGGKSSVESSADTSQSAVNSAVAAPTTAEPTKEAGADEAVVTVSRTPAMAVVTIDGVTVLGAMHTLAPGKHEVKATADGYEPLSMKIQARPGPMKLPIRLKKVTAAPSPPPVVAIPTKNPETPAAPTKPAVPVVKKPAEKHTGKKHTGKKHTGKKHAGKTHAAKNPAAPVVKKPAAPVVKKPLEKKRPAKKPPKDDGLLID